MFRAGLFIHVAFARGTFISSDLQNSGPQQVNTVYRTLNYDDTT